MRKERGGRSAIGWQAGVADDRRGGWMISVFRCEKSDQRLAGSQSLIVRQAIYTSERCG